MSGTWRSRIAGSGEEDPSDLLANPRNWRIHPDAQQQAMAGVLNEVGWVQQVVVNRTTGHVIDGHLRVSLAISRGEPRVPVLYVDLSEGEERLVLATLDSITALAVTDEPKFAELLEDLTVDDGGLSTLLESLGEGLRLDDLPLHSEPQPRSCCRDDG